MFIAALLVAAIVFIGFMSLVGSPSEIETVIGLIIAVISFLFSVILGWRWKSKSHEKKQNDKISELERELEALKSRK